MISLFFIGVISVVVEPISTKIQLGKKLEIKRARFDGILIDTKNKNNGNLRNYLNIRKLENFIKVSKKENLSIGLAGSLNIKDIDPLLKLEPDYLGFRGALCIEKKRKDNISENLLNRVISKFRFFSFQKAI